MKKYSYTKNSKRINCFARAKNNNLPKSEVWFYSMLQKEKFPLLDIGFSNAPLNDRYIPDILNETYMYVIEIDGSIHNLDYIKERDIKKTEYYRSLGFSVFRIEAFNEESFYNTFKWVKLIHSRKAPKKRHIQEKVRKWKKGFRHSNFEQKEHT